MGTGCRQARDRFRFGERSLGRQVPDCSILVVVWTLFFGFFLPMLLVSFFLDAFSIFFYSANGIVYEKQPRLSCMRVFLGVVDGKCRKKRERVPRLSCMMVFLGVVAGKCRKKRERASRLPCAEVFLGVVAGKWPKTQKTWPRLSCGGVFIGVVAGGNTQAHVQKKYQSTMQKEFQWSFLDGAAAVTSFLGRLW